MGIIDAQAEFSDAQVVTVTAFGTNAYDRGTSGAPLGTGGDLEVEFIVDIAMAAGTSIAFEIVESANADLSSPTVVATSGAVVLANLDAIGDKARVKVPSGEITARYWGVRYTVVGTFSGGGAISAYVLGIPQDAAAYLGVV